MEKKPQKRTLTVDLPQGSFPLLSYVNLVGIEPLGAHRIVHFGCEISGGLVAGAVILFESEMLKDRRESWLQYLAQIGLPETEEPMTWRCPSDKLDSVPVANTVMLSRSDEHAEIRCYNYSMGDTLNAAQETKTKDAKVRGQALALFRCEVDLQRQLIAQLYGDLPV